MSNTKKYLDNLSKELDRLGHQEAASDVSSLSFDPLTLGFASGGLNLESFTESGDDIEIDFDQADRILEIANLDGFGGMCAEAAVAINEIVFKGKGRLVAAVNKKLWKRGEFVGHVAVEWEETYWDAEGEKTWDKVESFGMVDESDPDYADFFDSTEEAYEVEKIYPSREELTQMFGGCNLEKIIKRLEAADKEVRGEV